MLPFKALYYLSIVHLMVEAQVTTECDPREEDCPPSSAIGGYLDCDFTETDLSACRDWKRFVGLGLANVDEEKGIELSVSKYRTDVIMGTTKSIFFGRVDVQIQAVQGPSTTTEISLNTTLGNQILFWISGSGTEAVIRSIVRGPEQRESSNPHATTGVLKDLHEFSIEWTATSISWLIDDREVRYLASNNFDEGEFPLIPMRVAVHIAYAAADSTESDDDDEESKGPFTAYLKRVLITDYGGGDDAVPAVFGNILEYKYTGEGISDEDVQVVFDNSSDSTTEGSDEPEIPSSSSTLASASSAPTTTTTTTTSSPPPSQTDQSESNSGAGLSKPAIIAIAVVLPLFLIIAALGLFCCWRIRRRKATRRDTSTSVSHSDVKTDKANDAPAHGIPELDTEPTFLYSGPPQELANTEVARASISDKRYSEGTSSMLSPVSPLSSARTSQYDARISQYNTRASQYDPATGRYTDGEGR